MSNRHHIERLRLRREAAVVSALTVEDVFGVSGNDVASYVERDHVDDAFLAALHTDQQIVVYGASKQGKTALVKKHINYDDSIVITLSPKMLPLTEN